MRKVSANSKNLFLRSRNVGIIPNELANMQLLLVLRLDHNQFTGLILPNLLEREHEFQVIELKQ